MCGNPVHPLRQIAKIEAISFLLLLGIAMPLKYLAGMPMAVKVAGWIHGLLFVVFCGALLHAMVSARWSLSRAAAVFISALLPFGPFLLDKRMAAYQREFGESRPGSP
jgi:integral membrane protein